MGRWRQFCRRIETGHRVVMDGPPDLGGRDLGPRPMEMLLMGMGGCASFDVLSMLKNPVRMSKVVLLSSVQSGPMQCRPYLPRCI